MAEPVRYGSDVYVLSDQERCSSVTETMQGNQRELFILVFLLGIMVVYDPVKSLVRSIKGHQGTIPLDKQMIVAYPLSTDRKPVCCLLLFPEFGHIYYHGGDGHHSAGFWVLWSLYDILTIYPTDAFADIDCIIFKIQIWPGKSDQFAPAASGKDCQIEEQL